jgi:hypothetical protein
MSPTIAHLLERMGHATAHTARRRANAARWLTTAEGYRLAARALTPFDPMRHRAAVLGAAAQARADFWTRLAEGEPRAALAVWRGSRPIRAMVPAR